MEMSHRGKDFTSIIEAAEKDMRELLNVPSNFKVLFLQGGATAQFAAVPLNLLGERGAKADYIVTGVWGEKAHQECNKYGLGNVVISSKSCKFTSIPSVSDWNLSDDAKYVHYTLNETVNGVEFDYVPDVGDIPLVGDHSSSFMSRPIDWAKHACIYAGVQKNAGCAGNTVVIVREDLLGKALPDCPTYLNWKIQADGGSMYNTPACYPIYMMGLYLKYMKRIGGIEPLQVLAEKRSKMLYETIEASDGFYRAPVQPSCRSRVNVPFVIYDDDAALSKKFLSEAAEEGLVALSGHRSVGGLRASLYNAMPLEGVAKLCKFMKKFHGQNIREV